MASGYVWGIDIGQCALKALRARLDNDGQAVTVDSFDFIEYPKILSQPDADPGELVREALKQFLSRNSLRGDKVAISVSGQSGLARFIKLPPVDAKQLPKLVFFEAKQQIPFALEDVVWDYQQMEKIPSEDEDEDDFDLENEVGLFAMKRDQVLRAIRPLIDAEVEIDIIQLTPICIYNAIAFDQLAGPEGFDPAKVNEWTMILSMGTDTSDLVVTNGFRVWQRSIPLGGSHFTKQLTKDLKLTFAKAEHVKRDVRNRDDAKQVFQAMRPIFNDLVTEIQRSVGYFNSLDRTAEITQVVALGNAMKLPGLAQYLEKNLGRPVKRLDSFSKLTGSKVTEESAYRENMLAFPVCYGLVLQGLGAGQLRTNLVPREIVQQRLIRRKKPWATGIAAALLLGCTFNYIFHYTAWSQVHEDKWESVETAAKRLQDKSSQLVQQDEDKQQQLQRLEGLGEATVGSADGRLLWLELLEVITDCLPKDENLPVDKITTLDERPLESRPEIYIDSIESKYYPDLTQWYTGDVQEKYAQLQAELAQMQAGGAATTGEAEAADAADESNVPPPLPGDAELQGSTGGAPTIEGGGWVIEIKGHHFNDDYVTGKAQYVRTSLLDQLASGKVMLPTGPEGEMTEFGVDEMGILCPILVEGYLDKDFAIDNPEAELADPKGLGGGFGGEFSSRPGMFFPGGRTNPGQQQEDKVPAKIYVPAFRFIVQFCWKQVPLKLRLKNRETKNSAAEVASTQF